MSLTLLCLLLPAVQAQTTGQVKYFPRVGLESRMVGGLFQGSPDNTTWTTLYTVAAAPADAYTTATFTTNPTTFRFLRYLAPSGSYGNVAEVEFDSVTGGAATKLSGTGFGTAGSYNSDGNTYGKALDGSTSTFFNAPAPGSGDFVGMDRGAPVLTSLSVSPATASLSLNKTQAFTAAARDQYGNLLSPQPLFTWSVVSGGVGTVSASGVYSSGATAGSASVKATSGTVSGTAAVTVTNAAPTVVTAAVASPSPATGTTTALSVLGADDGGEASLTYTWATAGMPPAAVTFSANSTNAAKTTTATFTKAGSYSLQVTIKDAGGLSVSSSVAVTVSQTLTSIALMPSTASLTTGGTQTFTASAKDQFGAALSTQPALTWSVVSGGVGSITSGGVYSAGTTAGTATVKAASGAVSGTAAVTVNAAAATPLYLSNLTLNSTAVIGGTVTGTVTLSSASSTATIVALFSDNSAAVVPANVTIPAGAISQPFAISSNSVASPVLATLSARSGGWTQAATLSVFPATQSFAIQGVNSAPGNGCALLFWTDLPNGSIRGYNVYRVTGTTNTLLTSSLQQSPFYADTGLVNGTTYQYSVSAVDFQGQEHALCSPISVIPSSTLGILSWGAFPSPISDFVTLYASLDSAAVPSFTILLVDGKEFGNGDVPAVSTGSNSIGGSVEAGLDTTELSNGNHVVQLIGWLDENTVCATPPQTISVSNSISNLAYDDTVDPGSVAQINATVPTSAPWTVSVTNEDTGSVVRTWQGTSALLHLAWDGTDSTGTQVPDGTYAAAISASGAATLGVSSSPNSAGPVSHKVRLYRLTQPFQGLALIDKIATDTTKDEALRVKIQSDFDKMASNYSGFKGYAISAGIEQQISPRLKAKILHWLSYDVVDLYISSHGYTSWTPGNITNTHLEMNYGDCVFFAPQTTHGSKLELFKFVSTFDGKTYFDYDMTAIVQDRQQRGQPPYNFVMMDGCDQGGGRPENPPQGKKGLAIDHIGPDNNLWGKVFGVGTDAASVGGCFLGWSGYGATNDAPDWLKWRFTFWDSLAVNGKSVQQAITDANRTLPGTATDYIICWDGSRQFVEPNDSGRLNAFQFPGQTYLP